ncbi:MAG: 30S ribosomal protein S19 [Candidatus Heimdallarchaeota archaeon]|nr:MAG: 30S ribosomal protein S19 [Candidatus Heimdallarchaeota archaeon]
MSSRRAFRYRGFSLDELRQKSMDEFISLLPARQRRSLTRGMSTQHIKLMERIISSKSTNRPVRTHCRDFIILPELIGSVVQVYNGREFLRVELKPEMLGHYLGEFAPTCKQVKHSAPGIGATRGSQFVPLK